MVATLLPLYVVYILNEGVDKLGVVIGVATFVSYFFRILFGYLSDRFGLVKPLVVIGYLISAITKPLLAFTHTYQGVAALRGLERIGKAVRSAPKDALISAYSADKQSGKAFGFHKTMDVAGELGGAIFILLLLVWLSPSAENFRVIFAMTLFPGLIATFIAWFFVNDIPPPLHTAEIQKPAIKVLDRRDLRLMPLIAIYVFAVFFMLSGQFLLVAAKGHGYELSFMPLFVIVLTLTQFLTSYASGVAGDRMGSGPMLLIAFVFGCASVAALWQGLLWFSFIALGLFTVISLNAMRAYIAHYAKSQGFIFGIFYGGVAFFGPAGALVMGQLWQRLGFDFAMTFALAGMLALTIMLAAWTVFHYRMRKQKNAIDQPGVS